MVKISIIIPAYNEEKRIRNCLKSILSQDNSLLFEVIVVNNASCDNTIEVIKSINFPIKIVEEPKQGLTIARNSGAKVAKGDLLVFLDADVILPNNWLKNICGIFKNNPRLVCISGPYKFYDLPSKYKIIEFMIFKLIYPIIGEFFLKKLLHKGTLFIGGNISILKDVFSRVGGFDESIIFYGEDANLARKISNYGLAFYRQDIWVWSSARRFLKNNPYIEGFRYLFYYSWFLLTGHSLSKGVKHVP